MLAVVDLALGVLPDDEEVKVLVPDLLDARDRLDRDHIGKQVEGPSEVGVEGPVLAPVLLPGRNQAAHEADPVPGYRAHDGLHGRAHREVELAEDELLELERDVQGLRGGGNDGKERTCCHERPLTWFLASSM